MIASGYSISLNCDRCGNNHIEFGGYESSQIVWRIARNSGWKINKAQRTCVCPECLKEMELEDK